ncbi:hypothetical protein E4K72_12685 [Oxalobacteraceae bacterium OM1]|nr:hypothetical protein E4K72_12685 [Oxalobacteraceae bacterium OM1]
MIKTTVVALTFMLLCIKASAEPLALKKIEQDEFKVGSEAVEKLIAADNIGIATIPFDQNQTFKLLKGGAEVVGYLFPVKFSSTYYRNTICRLYLLAPDFNGGYVELLAERNSGDEIVRTCIGLNAVALDRNTNGTYYLASVRYRIANHYGSTGVALRIEERTLIKVPKLDSCITRKGEVESISLLRDRLRHCY